MVVIQQYLSFIKGVLSLYKTISLRIESELVEYVEKEAKKLKQVLRKIDQTMDRSKYIRQLIRQDMERKEGVIQESHKVNTEEYYFDDFIHLPQRRE